MVSKNDGELGKDNLAKLDNTENYRPSVGIKRYVVTYANLRPSQILVHKEYIICKIK